MQRENKSWIVWYVKVPIPCSEILGVKKIFENLKKMQSFKHIEIFLVEIGPDLLIFTHKKIYRQSTLSNLPR